MKSTAQPTFVCGLTSTGWPPRAGTRFFTQRGTLSRIWQYTRHSRLWFQRGPVLRNRPTYFQNPQRGFVVLSAVKASMTGPSRWAQLATGRQYVARLSPTVAQAG